MTPGTNRSPADDYDGVRKLTMRFGAVLAAVVVAAVVAAPGAWAHSRLESTAPAASARVTAPLSEVTLTFNERVHQRFSVVEVTGQGSVGYARGQVRVIDNVVHQAVYPLRSGAYTVRWRVVSADTHPVQGEFAFTVALPAGEEPTAGPPAAAPTRRAAGTAGSASLWPWLLGLLVVVVLAAVAMRLRRRSRPAADGAADREAVGDDGVTGESPTSTK